MRDNAEQEREALMSDEREQRPIAEEESASETAQAIASEAAEKERKEAERAEGAEESDETAAPLDREPTVEAAEFERIKAELAEEQERHLRLRADFENFRRRVNLDREAAAKYRAQSLLTDLLPVLDNFERAMQVEVAQEESKSVKKGFEMIYSALLEAAKREGLEPIEAVGKPFDPNFHQAIMQERAEGEPPGVVLEELQRGYALNGRILRPSMVKVNE